MDYGDSVKVLRGIPLFAKLDPAKLKLVAFASDYLTFEDGEALFQVGEPADCAYLIEDGEAEVVAEVEGRDVIVSVLGKNQMFGEMALFLNSPRTATVRAKGPLGVLRIEADMFLGLVTENPDTALGVMRALSDKLTRAMESYEELDGKVRVLESLNDSSDPRA